MRNALSLLAVVLSCGCSSTPAAPPDIAMVPPDLSPPADLFMYPALDLSANQVSCGANKCAVGEKCCYGTAQGDMGAITCAKTCPADAIGTYCNGPSDCGGYPCCFSISSSQGQTVVSDTACVSVPTECPPQFDLLAQVISSRLCTADSDCTAYAPDTKLNRCCGLSLGGQPVKLCGDAMLSTVLKQLGVDLVCPM